MLLRHSMLGWATGPARVLLAQSAALDRFPGLKAAARVWRLEAEVPEAFGGPLPGSDPGQLAYVIYTSGSTGRPKGVEVEHRGLANLAAWHRRAYGITPSDRATRIAGPAFDAAVWEVWPYLTAGASLHIPDAATVLSPPRLISWLARHAITHAFLPTPLAEALLEEPWPADAALRVLLTGGDRLHRGPRPDHPFALWNHYGPTESSVVATWGRVAGTAAAPPPIGRPIDGVEVRLDESGEILIGGAGLARGYRGRPDLTAERFVPDPLGAPGERLYRTGDLARILPSGELDFVGRADFQVKVRGFRIELGEIEAALRRQPGVREAVVLALEGERGEKRLAGYVVGETVAAELRAALGRELPDYMVPAAWVFLDALPLTPNGKVDRAALPAPERGEDGYVAPRTEAEAALAAIFAEVLDLPRVGVEDDFFALGGHSLTATRALSRLRARLGVDLPPRALFENPTVAGLVREVAVALGTGGEEIQRIPRPETGDFEPPVSFSQQGLWFVDRLSPGSALYNTPFALDLDGPLDVAALGGALAEIVRRHEALRTTFRAEAGQPVQVVARDLKVVLPFVDLSGLPDGEEAARLADLEARRPFDLKRGPVLRLRLLRLGADKHVLLALMHHIVSDDWSIQVFTSELAALYAAFSRGLPSPLAELPIQYGDFAAWQRRRLQGEALERELAWWRERLRQPLPVLDLPADRPRPALRTPRGARLRRTIPRGLAEALGALGREAEATPFIALLGVFDVLLLRHTGSPDVLVGSPTANRQRVEVEGLIGYFVNLLALRGDLSGNPSFGELLGRLRETMLGVYAHQELPFESLVEELAPVRDLSRNPLVDVFLILGNAPRPPAELAPGVRLGLRELDAGAAKVDLSLQLEETGNGLATVWEYSTDLFDAATVERMADRLEALMAGLVAAPKVPILDLPLLSAAERAQLAAWNEEPFERERRESAETLHGLFEAQARRTPEAVALIAGEERLTYRELDVRSEALARSLRARGVGPEVGVGILLERRAEMVVALLATLKAGGFYVPLDPAYPAERLELLVADSGCALVLMGTELDGDVWGPEAGPGNLAYLIYTSGSTGRPKAVAVEHRSAVALARWARREFSARELSGRAGVDLDHLRPVGVRDLRAARLGRDGDPGPERLGPAGAARAKRGAADQHGAVGHRGAAAHRGSAAVGA